MADTKKQKTVKLALTIKLLKTKLLKNEYRQIYRDLLDEWMCEHPSFFVMYMYEEVDKHDILHLHGLAEAPCSFGRWQLLRKGFNINVKPIHNLFGWEMYAGNYGQNRRFEQYNVPNENYCYTSIEKGDHYEQDEIDKERLDRNIEMMVNDDKMFDDRKLDDRKLDDRNIRALLRSQTFKK